MASLTCVRCGSEILDTEEKCATCGWNAGPLNIRAVEVEEELSALEQRYQDAIAGARRSGNYDHVLQFEARIRKSCAVINVNLNNLYFFITDDKEIYSGYSIAVDSGTRRPTKSQNDRERRDTEGRLFGSYGKEVRYAALSLDGSGLSSYGLYAIKLRDVAIDYRSTLLEDNSYHFTAKHKLQNGENVPPGHRATWKQRHKLAISKLAAQVSSATSEVDYSKLLLSSAGDRAADEFIEVHIYGGFDNRAIESVKGKSSPDNDEDRAMIAVVKRYLKKAGKDWVEEEV